MASAWKNGLAAHLLVWAVWGSVACAILPNLQNPDWISGQWADQAFSEVMSRRLGVSAQIEEVRFVGWTHVRFGKVAIHSTDGRLLFSAESGAIYLRQFAFRKDGFFETEIFLKGTELMRDFYRTANPGRFWTRFMRRPLRINSLKARILQNDLLTNLRIMECQSSDLRMDGEMVFESSGHVQDRLRTSMTPLQFISTVS